MTSHEIVSGVREFNRKKISFSLTALPAVIALSIPPLIFIDFAAGGSVSKFALLSATKTTGLLLVALLWILICKLNSLLKINKLTLLALAALGPLGTICGGIWINYALKYLKIRDFIPYPRLIITSSIIGAVLLPWTVLISVKRDHYKVNLQRAQQEFQVELKRSGENSIKAVGFDALVQRDILSELEYLSPTGTGFSDVAPVEVINQMQVSVRSLMQSMEQLRQSLIQEAKKKSWFKWIRISLDRRSTPSNPYLYSSVLLVTSSLVIARNQNLNESLCVFLGFLSLACISRLADHALGIIRLKFRILFETCVAFFGAFALYLLFKGAHEVSAKINIVGKHPHFFFAALSDLIGIAFLSVSLQLTSLRYKDIYANLSHSLYILKEQNNHDDNLLAEILREYIQFFHGTIQTKLVSAALVSDKDILGESAHQLHTLDFRSLLKSARGEVAYSDLSQTVHDVIRPWIGMANFETIIAPEIENLPGAILKNIHAILEEAVTNSIRHGHADHITIELGSHNDSVILCTVLDNGMRGLAKHRGFGMALYDRIVGDRWSLVRDPEGGTLLTLSFHLA